MKELAVRGSPMHVCVCVYVFITQVSLLFPQIFALGVGPLSGWVLGSWREGGCVCSKSVPLKGDQSEFLAQLPDCLHLHIWATPPSAEWRRVWRNRMSAGHGGQSFRLWAHVGQSSSRWGHLCWSCFKRQNKAENCCTHFTKDILILICEDRVKWDHWSCSTNSGVCYKGRFVTCFRHLDFSSTTYIAVHTLWRKR